jgi:hypothetical protein
MSLLWLVLAFLGFMALIGTVYALNRRAMMRYGTEPFSLPNAALMLLVNLLLLSALADAAGSADPSAASIAIASLFRAPALFKLLGAVALTLGMFWMIARRTSLWTACYAVPLMAVGAVVILPSLVFRYLATAPGSGNSA